MIDYIYPNELIKKAQSRIRAQLNGNGINPDETNLTIKRQGQSEFSAQTSYNLDYSVKTTQEKGRKSRGQVVATGQTQNEIKSLLSQFSQAETLKSLAETEIKKLPLQGLGADKHEIPLHGSKITLSEHVMCGRCHGQTKMKCTYCHGNSHIQCQVCYGRGLIRCMTCGGNGQVIMNGQPQRCNTCQGRRELTCTNCKGQRQLPCHHCQAKGYMSCSDCNAEGVNTIHTDVTPFLVTSSTLHVQELDDEPKRMVALVTPMVLIKGGHAQSKISNPPVEIETDRAYYQDAPAPKNKNTLFYTIQFPWAVGEIIINKTPHNIYLTGLKGAISESGKFMSQLIKPAALLIERASVGDGNISDLLKQACDYRISRETLQAVATQKPQKAIKTIHNLYSIGFPKSDLQSFVKNSYNALKKITRRPRYIGLAIGSIMNLGLYLYWFQNNLKSMFNPYLPHQKIALLIDGLPLIVSILISILTIKCAGYFTLKSMMNQIGVKTFKLPVAGTAGLYAIGINLIVWLGFILKPLLVH